MSDGKISEKRLYMDDIVLFEKNEREMKLMIIKLKRREKRIKSKPRRLRTRD